MTEKTTTKNMILETSFDCAPAKLNFIRSISRSWFRRKYTHQVCFFHTTVLLEGQSKKKLVRFVSMRLKIPLILSGEDNYKNRKHYQYRLFAAHHVAAILVAVDN